MDYLSLKKQIIDAGLLERQYGYYTYKIIFTFGLLALSIFLLASLENSAVQLLNAGFLAFVLGQIGLIMHDAQHQQRSFLSYLC